MRYLSYSSNAQSGLLRKAVALVATLALAVLVLMFSAVLLVVVLVIGVVAGAYLWWKTRAIRKQMRQMRDFPPRGANPQGEAFSGDAFAGEIIEGVAIRVDEPRQDRRR